MVDIIYEEELLKKSIQRYRTKCKMYLKEQIIKSQEEIKKMYQDKMITVSKETLEGFELFLDVLLDKVDNLSFQDINEIESTDIPIELILQNKQIAKLEKALAQTTNSYLILV